LNSTPDQRLKLSELRGKRVMLAFSPAGWSPVCGYQMTVYNHFNIIFYSDGFSKKKPKEQK